MFSVGFGSQRREDQIRWILENQDPTTAVILAAVHFEWMLKRTILKLGSNPTKALRKELENVYRIPDKRDELGYKSIWKREVKSRFKNAALGNVLGRLLAIQSVALDLRGRIVHGNGTASRRKAHDAVELFLGAGEKLRDFATTHGVKLDSRLRPRLKAR
ncbi:hypothetical protein BAC2_03049 [uncultured bacterium]|nr:hypothetical protein BAC2_03049 [uncultured bacterium]